MKYRVMRDLGLVAFNEQIFEEKHLLLKTHHATRFTNHA